MPIKKRARDIEKTYTMKAFVTKLRRFADALESGEQYTIQIKNDRVIVPRHAKVSIEHERTKDEEEIEFQIRWEKK